MKTPEILVDFRLWGATTAESLGITADLSWSAGDLVAPSPVRTYREPGWHLRSRSDPRAPLEEHLGDLLDRLSMAADRIRARPLDHLAEFSCAIYSIKGRSPVLTVMPETIARIASLRAALDLDLYDEL